MGWCRVYNFPDEWPPELERHLYYVWFDLVDWFLLPGSKQRATVNGNCPVIERWRANFKECAAVVRKRTNSNSTPVTLKKFDPSRKMAWANIALSDGDKAAITRAAANVEQVGAAFLGLAGFGLEVSFKQSADGGWMACAYGDDEQGTRRGVSAFAKSGVVACAALCQKWYVCMDSQWPAVTDAADDDDMR